MGITTTGFFIGHARNLPAGTTWIKITKGIFFDAALVPDDVTTWQLRAFVTHVRARSITLSRKSPDSLPVFTGEAALQMHGYDTWLSVPNFRAWRADGRPVSNRSTLDALKIGDVVIPACTFYSAEGTPTDLALPPREMDGLLLADASDASVDLARSGHPIAAITAISSYLAAEHSFTRFPRKTPEKDPL